MLQIGVYHASTGPRKCVRMHIGWFNNKAGPEQQRWLWLFVYRGGLPYAGRWFPVSVSHVFCYCLAPRTSFMRPKKSKINTNDPFKKNCLTWSSTSACWSATDAEKSVTVCAFSSPYSGFDFQAYISEGLVPHTSCPSSGFSSAVTVLPTLISFPCSLLTYPSLCVEVSVLPFCPSSSCVCLEVLFLCLPDGFCFVLDFFPPFFLLAPRLNSFYFSDYVLSDKKCDILTLPIGYWQLVLCKRSIFGTKGFCRLLTGFDRL